MLDALGAAHQNLTAVASGLGEADLMRPSRCAGWAVADVLYHQLLDARRALRTFASPSDAPVDRDDVSYWTDYAPGAGDDSPAHAAESAAHARYARAAAWPSRTWSPADLRGSSRDAPEPAGGELSQGRPTGSGHRWPSR